MQAVSRKAVEIFFGRLVFFQKRETAAMTGDYQSQVKKRSLGKSVVLPLARYHPSIQTIAITQ
ncbi:MAG: hypothetical protein FD121_141 [Gallionellaceae bacterium]|nr:MAG: hypothetical protein FD121_141 [Gallionellaceae bacterium]